MNVIKGAIGLAKCAARRVRLNLGSATPEIDRLIRIEICRTCPKAKLRADGKLTTHSRCGPCGCFIVCKTSTASEKCPLDRWPAIPAASE